VRLREMVVALEHPKLGTLQTLGTPIKPAGAMPFRPAPPPALGQHTDAILGGLLGYPAERIEALRVQGIIA
jgi:crotonobetainyl-CoA:carnitine CoA-transferase CaiB-like acyl-CoA transferase